jgi:hypothetical protein
MAMNNGPADLYLVSIAMGDPRAEAAVFGNHDIDFGCRAHARRLENGALATRAFATEATIARLREIPAVTVGVVLNASERSRARQEEVGRGDRFDGGRIAPRGLAEKTGVRGR